MYMRSYYYSSTKLILVILKRKMFIKVPFRWRDNVLEHIYSQALWKTLRSTNDIKYSTNLQQKDVPFAKSSSSIVTCTDTFLALNYKRQTLFRIVIVKLNVWTYFTFHLSSHRLQWLHAQKPFWHWTTRDKHVFRIVKLYVFNIVYPLMRNLLSSYVY